MAVLGFIIFELNVQAVLDADFHLDAVVALGVLCQRVHYDVLLLYKVTQPFYYCHA